MDIVKIQKINELHNKIHCEPWLAKELDQFFTFKVPGHQFTPQYKAGVWNGEIHLFNQQTRLIYGGLNYYIESFCNERQYEVEYLSDFSQREFSLLEANEFIDSLNIPSQMERREYQVQAFAHAVRNSRSLLISPTASGKSFIIYLITRFFNTKTLIITPTTSLVLQLYSDFQSYGFDSDKYCHKSTSGGVAEADKQIIITTWQSIYNYPKKWFKQFNMVIGDEAHSFKAKSLTGIMTSLDTCKYRFGFTGSLDGTQTHKLVLEGLFGPQKRVTTTHELIEQNHLSKFRIKCIILKHSEEVRKLISTKTYQEEIDFLVQNEKRNKFLQNLSLSLKGNTLLLFQYVEKHGKILYSNIQKSVEQGRSVYFVHGGVEGEDRESIRKLVEMEENAIIIASYGTFSTGVNIKNLHNIIFASPSKSRIRNLQSIGRGLRKGDNKQKCTLFDIADDIQHNKKKNFTLQHFVERMKIYNEEKFESKIYTVTI